MKWNRVGSSCLIWQWGQVYGWKREGVMTEEPHNALCSHNPLSSKLLAQVEPRATQEVILTFEQCLRRLGHEPGHCKLNAKVGTTREDVVIINTIIMRRRLPNLKQGIVMLQALRCIWFLTPSYPLAYCIYLKSNTIDTRNATKSPNGLVKCF